jgi:membrane protease YdiL (CAAX protease family)
MATSSLIVLAWIPFRLAVGFAMGLACDAILVASWLLIHIRSDATFGVQFTWQLAPMYCLIGYLIYRLSCMALGSHAVNFVALGTAYRNIPWLVFLRVCVLAPLHEEITWRLVAQYFLTDLVGPLIGLVATAILFTAWHRSVWNSPLQALELFLFSVVLGASMAFTSDLLLPICLHAVRNVFVLTRYHLNALA